MSILKITGPTKVNGTVTISGAKNAALPVLFAAILATEKVIINNVPRLSDTLLTCDILRSFNAQVSFEGNTVIIDPTTIDIYKTPFNLAKEMRASIYALAPLVAKYHNAEVSLPGGCNIGSRPVDMHISAVQALGVNTKTSHGFIIAECQQLKAADIYMDKISVGATVTALMATVLANGTSNIFNAAIEPEVVATAEFLNTIGAKISGIGTNHITIEGVAKLNGGSYSIIPDRIEAGTFLIAAAASGGKVTCNNIDPSYLQATLIKLASAGAKISSDKNSISLDMEGKRPVAVDIVTNPHPGIPTDLQAQFCVLNAVAQGNSTVTETIFENRFMHIPELQRMGADIYINGNQSHFVGIGKLSSATVKATDLRAGAAFIIAAGLAEGTSYVEEISHILRGYEQVVDKFQAIGYNISLTEQADEA